VSDGGFVHVDHAKVVEDQFLTLSELLAGLRVMETQRPQHGLTLWLALAA